MKIATWNVNSIRQRLEHLGKWLAINEPDCLCLQETKVTDELFPIDEIAAMGYHALFAGQKSYNGVALLTRSPAEEGAVGFAHLPADHPLNEQRRIIAATVAGVRVYSVYVPNGEAVGSDKFDYKLAWLREFRRMLDERRDAGGPLAVCGDFNICTDAADLYNPEEREGGIHFSAAERAALAEVKAFGLVDLFRRFHDEPGRYSWWDYRGGMFWKKLGMRLDLILATAPLAARAVDCDIDERPRRWKKPSDHTVVVATFHPPGE